MEEVNGMDWLGIVIWGTAILLSIFCLLQWRANTRRFRERLRALRHGK